MRFLISTNSNGQETFYSAYADGTLQEIGTEFDWSKSFDQVTFDKITPATLNSLSHARLYVDEDVQGIPIASNIGIVKSTNSGALNTRHYAGVERIRVNTTSADNPEAALASSKYALSFDGRQNWYIYEPPNPPGLLPLSGEVIPDTADKRSLLFDDTTDLELYPEIFVDDNNGRSDVYKDNWTWTDRANEVGSAADGKIDDVYLHLNFKEPVVLNSIHVKTTAGSEPVSMGSGLRLSAYYYDEQQEKWILIPVQGEVVDTVDLTLPIDVSGIPSDLEVTKWKIAIKNNSLALNYLNVTRVPGTISGGWKPIDIGDIEEDGMSYEVLTSLTKAEYDLIYRPGTLDWAIFLADANSITGLTFTMTPNSAPVVMNFQLSSSSVHFGNGSASFTVIDPENTDTYYRVKINGVLVVTEDGDSEGWVLVPSSDTNVTGVNIPNEMLYDGINAITLEVKDVMGAESVYNYPISKSNVKPVVIGVREGNGKFKYTITDADLDKVTYEIKLNDETIHKVTTPVSTPLNEQVVTWDENLVKLDEVNTLEIVVTDEYGESYTLTNTWVGEANGIMFKDETGTWLSNNLGTILKELDMGYTVAKKETKPVKVIVINRTSSTAVMVTITSNDILPNGLSYALALDEDMTNKTTSLNIGDMQPGEEKTIYVQLISNSLLDIGPQKINYRASSL